MNIENVALDPRQRRARRLQLGQDVHAVPSLLHHRHDATHLTFDPSKTR